jgi:hypothetical protein
MSTATFVDAVDVSVLPSLHRIEMATLKGLREGRVSKGAATAITNKTPTIKPTISVMEMISVMENLAVVLETEDEDARSQVIGETFNFLGEIISRATGCYRYNMLEGQHEVLVERKERVNQFGDTRTVEEWVRVTV